MGRKRNKRGFTLLELAIVIVIFSVLSTLSVSLYRGYTRKMMAEEGKSVVLAIAAAEKDYFNRFKVYSSASGTYDTILNIDVRRNKYFRTFNISVNGGGADSSFTATTAGSGDASGITVTYSQPSLNNGGVGYFSVNGL